MSYDKYYAEGGWKYDLQKEKAFFKKIAPITPYDKSVIDIGCGDGFFAGVLEDYFGLITGIDLSGTGIGIATQNYPRHTFIQGDFLAMGYNKAFDVAFCRAPGFFSHNSCYDPWQNALDKIIKATREYIIYIHYSARPFQEYRETFNHDPEILKDSILKNNKVASVNIRHIKNYIAAIINL
jgi:SAM-dependent methyltransferase